MILPFRIRDNKGSFVMSLPRALGFDLHLDEILTENKSMQLIAESVESGVLIRHPSNDEIKRFKIGVVNELYE